MTANQNDNRVATYAMNGYMYQRYYTILWFLQEGNNYEYILEEGNEDIDMIKSDNTKTLIQIKYLETSKSGDTISKDSGLMKVIKSSNNVNDIKLINNIKYITYSNCKIYNANVKKAFEDKKYANIGKYVLLALHWNNKTNKLSSKLIMSDGKLNILFDKNIPNMIGKNFYNIFSDAPFCNIYFSKFELMEGLSHNVLLNTIRNKISQMYSQYISLQNSNESIDLILYSLFHMFATNMFIHPEKNTTGRQHCYIFLIVLVCRSYLQRCILVINVLRFRSNEAFVVIAK